VFDRLVNDTGNAVTILELICKRRFEEFVTSAQIVDNSKSDVCKASSAQDAAVRS